VGDLLSTVRQFNRSDLTEEDVKALALSDPDDLERELDKLDCEATLRNFIKLGWSVIEPGRLYKPNWHIDCISDHLEAVSRGDITRIMFNLPPGGMKSLTTNAFWPAYEWGPMGRPDLRYVSAAYNLDLTVRDNRRTRSLIQSPWYQALWGDRYQLVGDQNAKTRFDTDRMGFKIATSVGGLGTGERGDRFIIDDPHNIKDGESTAKRNESRLWFQEVVPTRMSDPAKSAIVVIMQRVHEADIAGAILERDLGYVVVSLPMEFEPERRCFVEITGWSDPREEPGELLWPSHMSRAIVERDKKAMGEYAVAGQFQQRPAPRGGGMFKRAWWRFFETGHRNRPMDVATHEEAPAVQLPPSFDWTVITVDAAFKATTTGSRVGMLVIAGKGPFRYVLANRTAPMTFGKTVDGIMGLMAEFPKCTRVLIEDKANGPAIVDTLRQKIAGVIPVNPEGGKEARASAMQPSVESGHWILPEGAAWLDDFITEFALFPSGAKNDQVDATSQAAIYMTQGASVARALSLAKL
jgi:predicted phage terminase large subunit-like protein